MANLSRKVGPSYDGKTRNAYRNSAEKPLEKCTLRRQDEDNIKMHFKEIC